MADEHGHTCPNCGEPYDARYTLHGFNLGLVRSSDEICRDARYVHVHRRAD